MEQRKEEIELIIDHINTLCLKFEISLVPKQLKNGSYVVGVLDEKYNKQYVLVKGKE